MGPVSVIRSLREICVCRRPFLTEGSVRYGTVWYGTVRYEKEFGLRVKVWWCDRRFVAQKPYVNAYNSHPKQDAGQIWESCAALWSCFSGGSVFSHNFSLYSSYRRLPDPNDSCEFCLRMACCSRRDRGKPWISILVLRTASAGTKGGTGSGHPLQTPQVRVNITAGRSFLTGLPQRHLRDICTRKAPIHSSNTPLKGAGNKPRRTPSFDCGFPRRMIPEA